MTGLRVLGYIPIILILSFAAVYTWSRLPIYRDATDPPGGRSGLILRTDAETGLQYLESHSGFLIPRIGTDGRQMRASKQP
jgi:hypothetical protein